ncbi:ferritin [uncultured Rikenella sp.]|uniref:ferritin n=1 Tax=uncultured Rikenella sp. TaxID=368003 RepID=UPI00261E7260|nr:ferritin [uncultured Rikenella sp.]
MLSTKLQEALNAQINAEQWSAYLYLSMSLDASVKGYKGIANWFSIQYQEEQAHAQLFIDYILSRGGRVTLAPIAAVPTEWATPLDMFRETLAHEQKVTSLIDNLCRLAADEQDFATSNQLIWFVNEQVEEEENARDIIDQLQMVSESQMGLYMIDKELGTRTYTAPSIAAQ